MGLQRLHQINLPTLDPPPPSYSCLCVPLFARFLTLLRATFVEARESGSDVDAAALEVGRLDGIVRKHSVVFAAK